MIVDSGKYYLYRHIRLDNNQVFYIGIGTKSKKAVFSEYERAYSKTRSKFWTKIVDKTDYKIEIILESNDYDFINSKEIEFISLYGRRDLKKGSLCNLTDGGSGLKNYKISQETRNKISISSKGRPSPNKGRCWDEHFKKRISESLKGNKLKTESIIKRTKTLKEKALKRGYYQSDSWRKNIGKANSKKVYEYTKEMNLINEFTSCHDAELKTNITFQMISYACKKFPKPYKNRYFSYEKRIGKQFFQK